MTTPLSVSTTFPHQQQQETQDISQALTPVLIGQDMEPVSPELLAQGGVGFGATDGVTARPEGLAEFIITTLPSVDTDEELRLGVPQIGGGSASFSRSLTSRSPASSSLTSSMGLSGTLTPRYAGSEYDEEEEDGDEDQLPIAGLSVLRPPSYLGGDSMGDRLPFCE